MRILMWLLVRFALVLMFHPSSPAASVSAFLCREAAPCNHFLLNGRPLICSELRAAEKVWS